VRDPACRQGSGFGYLWKVGPDFFQDVMPGRAGFGLTAGGSGLRNCSLGDCTEGAAESANIPVGRSPLRIAETATINIPSATAMCSPRPLA